MMVFDMFWNKVKIKEEQSKIMQLLELTELKLIKFEARLDATEQAHKVLRGFVNKKVGIEPDSGEEEPDTVEVVKDGYDELRKLARNKYN